MKKTLLVFSIVAISASALHAQQNQMRVNMEVIYGNRPPNPDESRMMREEERSHPNIAQAMHKIEEAMKFLQDAPDNFGGHKAQAQDDLKKAYMSLRKALYFRLYDERR